MGTIYINDLNTQKRNEEESESIMEMNSESNDSSDQDVNEASNFSPYMDNFLNDFEGRIIKKRSSSIGYIKVSEVLGGLARLYERVRSVVEYKGEHVLRRNAIERMLKRLVWEQGSVRETIDERRVAGSLIRELIWARYLPNDSVEKEKIDELQKVIEKYIYFLKNLDNISEHVSRSKARSWIWGIASSEIEDVLDPSNRDLYVRLMFEWFTDRFKWTDKELSDHDRNTQIFLAIHRAHAKSDEPIMRYNLLLMEIPDWVNATRENLNNFVINFPKIYDEIENHLEYKGRLTLYRVIQKHSAAFDIFREIANELKMDLRNVMADKKEFNEHVREVCSVKYAQIRKKVNTGIVRSIIYIFISKVVFAMIIEIPYEIYMYNDVRYIPLSINIIFPPIMMWIIGMSTRIPGAKNTESIISRLGTVIYPDQGKVSQNFSVVGTSRNSALSSVFAFLYFLLFLLVFGGISYILTLINFSLSGVIVFFFFLSLVMLFAFRVRFHAVQLRIDSENESFFSHLTSYLTLPFLNFGIFLSSGLSKLNFLSVILDFIIEAPLKSIIEIFEEWTSFIKEKKEEVIERPE